MTHDQPDVSEEQAQTKLREIATFADTLIERSATPQGFAIEPKSSLAGDDMHTDPYQTSHAVKMSITYAADHLHGLCALVLNSGFLHLAAPFTVARGALESASAAIWIASPQSRDERVRRTLRWNIKDVKDGSKAADDAGIPIPTPLADRKRKIEAVAAKRSIPFTEIKNGYTSTEAVEAAEKYVNNPMGVLFPWRVASGFAHGRRWSMLAFSEVMEKAATSTPGVTNVKMENDFSRVLFFAMAAALTIKGAIALYEKRGTAP
jgi:hypothetical protein